MLVQISSKIDRAMHSATSASGLPHDGYGSGDTGSDDCDDSDEYATMPAAVVTPSSQHRSASSSGFKSPGRSFHTMTPSRKVVPHINTGAKSPASSASKTPRPPSTVSGKRSSCSSLAQKTPSRPSQSLAGLTTRTAASSVSAKSTGTSRKSGKCFVHRRLVLLLQPEYDIASLYMVSFFCFVTKACARRPGAAASAAPCLQGRQAS
jgi:hypothetical protein